MTSKIYVRSKLAGQAIQLASGASHIPAAAPTAESNMAKGINGTTSTFVTRPTKDSWPNIAIISGKVITSAAKVSIATPTIIFGWRLNNLATTIGEIISTPKKAKNDRYQPGSPQI